MHRTYKKTAARKKTVHRALAHASGKKSIAIISSQYFWLPGEAGPTRFYSIARMFQENGYEVTVITSSFEHHEKVQRDKNLSSPFRVIYIDCPAYRKNIDLFREVSNRVFASGVRKVLKENQGQFDAVYCSLPPNNISKAAGRYCHRNHIPFIADIEDLWPEAMEMLIKKRVAGSLLFLPYKWDAEKTYQYADAVVGTSKEYSLRAFKYRNRKIPYRTVYVGCDLDDFDREAQENLDAVLKPDGEIWVTYAGSIGHSYAVDNIVKAARRLQGQGHEEIKFKILGTGPLKDKTQQLAARLGCKNVEFCGYMEHSLMAAVLVKSDVLVNSFAKGAPQSIVNKIGDYLAAGKPLINTLENEEFCRLVDENGIGVNVEAENSRLFCEALLRLLKGKRQIMGANARMLASKKFDRKHSYTAIKELVELAIYK